MSEVPPPTATDESPMCRIVFVCTGNTCRSPMAEAICKKQLADRLGCGIDELPARGFLVQSAGLAAGQGWPAAEEAVAIADSLGIDLRSHQSQMLTPELADQADLLLGMTESHVQAVQDIFAVPARLLSPTGEDVDDPIGQPLEVYDQCARQMAEYIAVLVQELVPPAPPSP